MNRRVQLILLAILAAILAITIMPPVTVTSYDNSGPITRVNPVVRYEFLFAESCVQINYFRLFLQYLAVLVGGTWLVLSQDKTPTSASTRVTELAVANDKLRQQITKGKYVEDQLKRQAADLMAAKERLGRQIAELNEAEQKWKTSSDQLEQDITRRGYELSRVNEQLQQQTAQRRKLEESLVKKIADLTSANEKIQQEADKYRILEEQLMAQRQQYNELFKEHSEQAAKLNELLHRTTHEGALPAESDEQFEHAELRGELFDVKEMKALAELARRLSKK
jgi:chromosome segregation ATPase